MATVTVYNSLGVPVGWGHYESREESRNIARGDAVVAKLVLMFLGTMLLAFSAALPMWQRIFIHPQVVRLHMNRTLLPILFGSALIALHIISSFVGLNDWSIGFFTKLGIAFLGLGILSWGLGCIHLLIGRWYPRMLNGNGYGLLNLHCLVTGLNPSHLLTVLQDGAIIGGAIYLVSTVPAQDRFTVAIFIGALVAAILGFTWHAQFAFADPDTIEFQNDACAHRGLSDERNQGSLPDKAVLQKARVILALAAILIGIVAAASIFLMHGLAGSSHHQSDSPVTQNIVSQEQQVQQRPLASSEPMTVAPPIVTPPDSTPLNQVPSQGVNQPNTETPIYFKPDGQYDGFSKSDNTGNVHTLRLRIASIAPPSGSPPVALLQATMQDLRNNTQLEGQGSITYGELDPLLTLQFDNLLLQGGYDSKGLFKGTWTAHTQSQSLHGTFEFKK